ncbi:hypothetical protein N9W84_00190 [bacterium]|nr:hypothetical protein [bacterium]
MGLKLLQPSLRPLGQFDVKDADLDAIQGGKYVELEDAGATEGYAADVGQVGPLSPAASATTAFEALTFALNSRTEGNMGGLADDGTTGYGTLYGTVIGGTAGQGTGLGALSTKGVVTVGPTSALASGKVTVWHAPGLYGVDTAAMATANPVDTDTALNAPIYARAAAQADKGSLSDSSTLAGVQMAINVGSVTDSSLVSTSERAVTSGLFTSTDREYFAIYYLGLNKA